MEQILLDGICFITNKEDELLLLLRENGNINTDDLVIKKMNIKTAEKYITNVDNININECNVDYSDREEIDKWLLSKYNNLVKNVRNSFSEYDLNKVTKYITSFVSDDLSNWYIRRNRNRFWGSKLNNSKKSVYMTTYEVLSGLCRLIAPIAPFVSEEIYTNLTGEKSVHLASYPVCNENLINPALEEKWI